MADTNFETLGLINAFAVKHFPENLFQLSNNPVSSVFRIINPLNKDVEVSITISRQSNEIIGVSILNTCPDTIIDIFDRESYTDESKSTIFNLLKTINDHYFFKKAFKPIDFSKKINFGNNEKGYYIKLEDFEYFKIQFGTGSFISNGCIFVSFRFNKNNEIVCIPQITLFPESTTPLHIAFDKTTDQFHLVTQNPLYLEDFWHLNKVVNLDLDLELHIESLIDVYIKRTQDDECNDFSDMSLEQKIEMLQMICV